MRMTGANQNAQIGELEEAREGKVGTMYTMRAGFFLSLFCTYSCYLRL